MNIDFKKPTSLGLRKDHLLTLKNYPEPTEGQIEALLIAHEVRECLNLLLKQGYPATHDELHYLLFLIQCQIAAMAARKSDNWNEAQVYPSESSVG